MSLTDEEIESQIKQLGIRIEQLWKQHSGNSVMLSGAFSKSGYMDLFAIDDRTGAKVINITILPR